MRHLPPRKSLILFAVATSAVAVILAIGAVLVVSGARPVLSQAPSLALATLLVLLPTAAAAFALAKHFEAAISRSVQALVEVAHKARERVDDPVHASNAGGDEVTAAVAAIEGMLTRFDTNKADLHRHRERLEAEVAARTVELSTANAGLVAARDQAETSSRMKSEFLAHMSHEIRTPINGVIGMTELALSTELTSVQRDYLETVRGSAHSLLSIINDILDFSKIEAGMLDMDPVDFDFRATTEPALRALALRASQKGVGFTLNIGPEVPAVVHGDAGRLRQVLMNLVGNAVKFTETGEVGIRVESKSITPEAVELHLQIRDSGIGIAADQQASIFAAFSQADRSTTRRFGGTGLGLAITSKLVELMKGAIWVESEVAKGSTFHVRIRLDRAHGTPQMVSPPPSAVHPLPSEVPPSGSARRRVLVAEDHPVNQMLAVRILEKAGFEVAVCGNGAEAVERMLHERFDIVLMDVQMPVMGGLEATRLIRQNESGTGRRTPILALTARAMKGDREVCVEAGMDDYATKPLDAASLVERVRLMTALVLAAPPASILPVTAVMAVTQEAPQALPREEADPVFDPELLREQISDNDVLISETIQVFLNQLPRMRAAVAAALEARNAAALEFAAHRLKGALATLAGPRAARAAGHLEEAGRKGDWSNVEAFDERLEQEIELLLPHYEALKLPRAA